MLSPLLCGLVLPEFTLKLNSGFAIIKKFNIYMIVLISLTTALIFSESALSFYNLYKSSANNFQATYTQINGVTWLYNNNNKKNITICMDSTFSSDVPRIEDYVFTPLRTLSLNIYPRGLLFTLGKIPEDPLISKDLTLTVNDNEITKYYVLISKKDISSLDVKPYVKQFDYYMLVKNYLEKLDSAPVAQKIYNSCGELLVWQIISN